jgi:hypothetical protein
VGLVSRRLDQHSPPPPPAHTRPLFKSALQKLCYQFPALAKTLTIMKQVKHIYNLGNAVVNVSAAVSGKGGGPREVLNALGQLAGALNAPGLLAMPGAMTSMLGQAQSLGNLATGMSALEGVLRRSRSEVDILNALCASLAMSDSFFDYSVHNVLPYLQMGAAALAASKRGPDGLHAFVAEQLFSSFERAVDYVDATLGMDMRSLSVRQQQLLVEMEATRGLDRAPKFAEAVCRDDMATAARLGKYCRVNGHGRSVVDRHATSSWHTFHFGQHQEPAANLMLRSRGGGLLLNSRLDQGPWNMSAGAVSRIGGREGPRVSLYPEGPPRLASLDRLWGHTAQSTRWPSTTPHRLRESSAQAMPFPSTTLSQINSRLSDRVVTTTSTHNAQILSFWQPRVELSGRAETCVTVSKTLGAKICVAHTTTTSSSGNVSQEVGGSIALKQLKVTVGAVAGTNVHRIVNGNVFAEVEWASNAPQNNSSVVNELDLRYFKLQSSTNKYRVETDSDKLCTDTAVAGVVVATVVAATAAPFPLKPALVYGGASVVGVIRAADTGAGTASIGGAPSA